MTPTLKVLGAWLARRAENLLVLMLAVMFVAFIIQIVFRYLINWPIGWTQELTVILWIWLVLFGAAFVIRESEEVRFDILHASAGARARRLMCLASGLALIVLYAVSLPAVVDYVAFMKVEASAYMKIRFDLLFSIYVVFAVAVILRYLWLCARAVWGRTPEAGSGA